MKTLKCICEWVYVHDDIASIEIGCIVKYVIYKY